MAPETVLRELRERYAAIAYYQDDGVVLDQLPGSDFINETLFTTYFARPARFRFDWISHHPYPPLKHIKKRHRIYQNADGVFSLYDWNTEPQRVSDIGLAISGAKGVSRNSSYTVPRMLTCITPAFASDFLTVQAVTDGETDDIPCRCVVAVDSRQRPYRLYIGRDDLLLYRVSSSVMVEATSDEIHRNIRIDYRIDENVFQGAEDV